MFQLYTHFDLNQLVTERAVNTLHFSLLGLTRDTFPADWELPKQVLPYCLLLAVEAGEVGVSWNGMEHGLLEGQCFVLDKGSVVAIQSTGEARPKLWMVAFSVHDAQGLGWSGLTSSQAHPIPLSSIMNDLYELARHLVEEQPVVRMSRHALFQKMIGFVLEHIRSTHAADHSRQAVAEIIMQLQHAFHEDMSVEELATRARLSKRRFTYWFKQLTGTHALDFITRLRINRAKQLLLSGGRLKDVARSIGYNDEFYFNRRFKQIEGISPKKYVQRSQQQPVSICAMGCLGHLLALGIKPASALVNLTEAYHLRDLVADIQRIRQLPSSLDEIVQATPGLIIARTEEEVELLSRVSTTLIFSQNRYKPMELLKLLGDTLGKQFEAERFIARYEAKAEHYREQLKSLVSRAETFSVIEIRSDAIYVFGNYWCRGGYNLYDGLQLAAPELVRKEMLNKLSYKIISPEELPNYMGDHLFLTITNPERARKLAATAMWQSLEPYRKNRIYTMDFLKLCDGDPISLYHQLDLQMNTLIAALEQRQLADES